MNVPPDTLLGSSIQEVLFTEDQIAQRVQGCVQTLESLHPPALSRSTNPRSSAS